MLDGVLVSLPSLHGRCLLWQLPMRMPVCLTMLRLEMMHETLCGKHLRIFVNHLLLVMLTKAVLKSTSVTALAVLHCWSSTVGKPSKSAVKVLVSRTTTSTSMKSQNLKTFSTVGKKFSAQPLSTYKEAQPLSLPLTALTIFMIYR